MLNFSCPYLYTNTKTLLDDDITFSIVKNDKSFSTGVRLMEFECSIDEEEETVIFMDNSTDEMHGFELSEFIDFKSVDGCYYIHMTDDRLMTLYTSESEI